MNKRIGPRMREVEMFVAAHPGLPMIRAAEYVGPHGSLQFGYDTVHRAVKAGLVDKVPGPRAGTWLLVPRG